MVAAQAETAGKKPISVGMIFTTGTLARITVTRGLQPGKEPNVAVVLKKVSAKQIEARKKGYGQFIPPPSGGAWTRPQPKAA